MGALDAATTAAVADYISSLLKPMYRAKRLSKEDCKWVTHKATAKVAEHGPSESGSTHFMSSKRKLKVCTHDRCRKCRVQVVQSLKP